MTRFRVLNLFGCSVKDGERTPDGGVAQLGEHLPCKQGVMGSNPIISTSPDARAAKIGERKRKLKALGRGRRRCRLNPWHKSEA